jgi:hypothetical protein
LAQPVRSFFTKEVVYLFKWKEIWTYRSLVVSMVIGVKLDNGSIFRNYDREGLKV